jgi:predicted DNA-binding transcriptional regulator AlpA
MVGNEPCGGNAGGQSATAGAPSQRIKHPVTGQSPLRTRRLLTFAQLREKLNVSERTARKIVAAPWMADPIELGSRVLRWDETEVDEALANRAPRRAEPAAEPLQLTRGKAAKAATAPQV